MADLDRPDRCAGAGQINPNVYTACPNPGDALCFIVLNEWAITVRLCPAHRQLFTLEAARLNTGANQPHAITLERPRQEGPTP